MSQVSTAASWIRPSHFTQETSNLLNSSEIGNVVEASANICEWTHVITGNKKAHETSEKLDVIGQALALPGVVENLGKFKNSCEKYSAGDGKLVSVVQNGLLVANKTAKSSFFFNSVDVIPLKQNLSAAKGVFWGSLGVLDAINVAQKIREVNELGEQFKTKADGEEKTILSHRWQIGFLNIIKSVNCIAQASIALVSILFVSLAHGPIFSPLVFLGLTSSWFALNFGVHFYEKIVDKWDADRKKALITPQLAQGT